MIARLENFDCVCRSRGDHLVQPSAFHNVITGVPGTATTVYHNPVNVNLSPCHTVRHTVRPRGVLRELRNNKGRETSTDIIIIRKSCKHNYYKKIFMSFQQPPRPSLESFFEPQLSGSPRNAALAPPPSFQQPPRPSVESFSEHQLSGSPRNAARTPPPLFQEPPCPGLHSFTQLRVAVPQCNNTLTTSTSLQRPPRPSPESCFQPRLLSPSPRVAAFMPSPSFHQPHRPGQQSMFVPQLPIASPCAAIKAPTSFQQPPRPGVKELCQTQSPDLPAAHLAPHLALRHAVFVLPVASGE